MSWQFLGGIPQITESVSTSPTKTPDSQPTDPVITPGGLAPEDNISTLGRLQQGSTAVKLIVLIEGVEQVLTDCSSTAAVQLAMKGTDWASSSILPGLFVELRNSQSISPDDPFANSGRCTIRVVDTTGDDEFGTLVNKRAGGAKTTITATVDRDDTTINVASTAQFDPTGTVYIGTERIAYGSKTATSFGDCTRAMYSPFGCASSGTGGRRFAGHHRIAVDPTHAGMNPAVTEEPRTWLDKRVGVWLHTWNEESEALNTHAQAQLVFAGRIAGIADDPETFHTVLDVEHESAAFKQTVIGQDMWAADLAGGMYIPTGRTFTFEDQKQGVALREANDLTVVASGASGANQMNAGWYDPEELCSIFNNWLGSELAAGRLYGHYSWASPVTTNDGLRTVCRYTIEDASSLVCLWRMNMPGEVATLLGIFDTEPGEAGQTEMLYSGNGVTTNEAHTYQGKRVPFTGLVFKPLSPGRLGQEFSETISYEAENERGVFVDQRALFPSSIKEACPAGAEYGLFLLDDKALMVGSYSAGVLSNCWLAPFQLASDNSTEAMAFIGRRADEPEAGPITLRQVFLFEDTWANIFKALAYSTGVAGYNHTSDTLGLGLGLSMPGELLGDAFDRSLTNLPIANRPTVVWLDEPTKFAELMRDDMRIARVFCRWKDRHFEFCRWQTPLVANATVTFSESNKAAPAGQQENHRIASEETDEWMITTTKVDYARDFATGRNAQYLRSVSLEDQTGGGKGRSVTLKMRNTFAQWSKTGAGVESLFPEYMITQPMFSRPGRRIVRSIDQRYFEGVSVGDIALVTDNFARDPLTGARGVNARAMVITRHTYDLGGPTAHGSVRDMFGEVELMALDTQRGSQYTPTANVDHEATFGGFDRGYNSTTSTLRCKPHDYSNILTIVHRGVPVTVAETLDATNLAAGDVVDIVERDPADPAAPITWRRTVDTVSGNDVTFTAGLSSPAWDNSKRYRLSYAPYSECQATQQDKAFQADDADEMIEDDEIPYHFSADAEAYDTIGNDNLTEYPELVPDQMAGDGKAYDCGHERALAVTLNALHDGKTLHQSPNLDSSNQVMGVFSEWRISYLGPVFFGTESLTSTITRSVIVAPYLHSADGSEVSCRVTISARLPITASSLTSGSGENARFEGAFSSYTWTTSSTTRALQAEQSLPLMKDPFFGYAYITVEINSNQARCPGLGKLIEGARTVLAA